MIDQEQIESVLREKMQFAIKQPDFYGGWYFVEILLVEWTEILFLTRGVENSAEETRVLHGEWLYKWTNQSKYPAAQTLRNQHDDCGLLRKAIQTAMNDYYHRIFGE